MTESKADLFLKSDGSLEVLIPETEVKSNKLAARRSITLSRGLIVSFLFVLIIGSAIVTYVYIARHRQHTWKRHINFYIAHDGKMMSDDVEYNPKEETISFFKCGTVTDLYSGFNAMILDNYLDVGPVCAIYDRIGFERHNVFGNEHNDDMMEEFLGELQNETHDAVLDEQFWEPKPEPIKDRSFLPRSIQRKCDNLPVYWLKRVEGRYKRQETEEEEEQEQPQEIGADDEGTDESAREALPPGLRVDAGESDHEKDCCQHCSRPYIHCRNVCVPLRRIEYPYFYRGCNSRACFGVFPCSYWYYRVGGQV